MNPARDVSTALGGADLSRLPPRTTSGSASLRSRRRIAAPRRRPPRRPDGGRCLRRRGPHRGRRGRPERAHRAGPSGSVADGRARQLERVGQPEVRRHCALEDRARPAAVGAAHGRGQRRQADVGAAAPVAGYGPNERNLASPPSGARPRQLIPVPHTTAIPQPRSVPARSSAGVSLSITRRSLQASCSILARSAESSSGGPRRRAGSAPSRPAGDRAGRGPRGRCAVPAGPRAPRCSPQPRGSGPGFRPPDKRQQPAVPSSSARSVLCCLHRRPARGRRRGSVPPSLVNDRPLSRREHERVERCRRAGTRGPADVPSAPGVRSAVAARRGRRRQPLVRRDVLDQAEELGRERGCGSGAAPAPRSAPGPRRRHRRQARRGCRRCARRRPEHRRCRRCSEATSWIAASL